MKKIVLFLAAVSTLFLLQSCQKENCGCVRRIVEINVPVDRWAYSNDDVHHPETQYNSNYFYCETDVPEITPKVMEVANVSVYRVMENGYGNQFQMTLPWTNYKEEFVMGEIPELDHWRYYIEKLEYDYNFDYIDNVGKLTIYYTVNDFTYEDDQTFVPDAMSFRCVILY